MSTEQQQYFPSIIPFRSGEKWGFSDRSKNLIIPPIYDQTFPFVGNVAKIRMNDKYGLIRTDGVEIFPAELDEIGNYYSGALLNEDGSISICKNGKFGLINTNGELLAPIGYPSETEALSYAQAQGWKGALVPNEFPFFPKEICANIQAIKSFQKGLAPFCIDGKWGLINRAGITCAEALYDEINSVENDHWPFRSGNKWGLLDGQGKIALEAKFDDARGFSNGQAACKIEGLWGAVNVQGDWIYQPQFTELGEFRDGLSAAQQNGLFGFVDENGKIVLDFQYPDVLDFVDQACCVFDDQTCYFIDTKGKKITKEYTRYFGPDAAYRMYVIEEEKWGIFNPNGQFILPISYDLPRAMGQSLGTIIADRIVIKRGPLMGYANLEGQEIVTPQYITVDPFNEGLSLVALLDPTLNSGKTPASIEASGSISGVFNFGFIDPSGKEIVPPKYILARRFEYGLAFVENSNFQSGYITYDGTEYFD